MEKEIIEGKFKIANFMGHNYESISNPVFKVNLYDLHDYDDSWNKLMPVWHKLRDTDFKHPLMANYMAQIVTQITYGEIADVFKVLVNAITWLNTQSK